MLLFQCWIQLCLKQDLLLGFLLRELINFLFGLSYLTIVSALATKKVLINCKDTPVCVLRSHTTTTLIRLLTLDVCLWGGGSIASNSLRHQLDALELNQF